MSEFSYSRERHGSIAVLRLRGELDYNTLPYVRDAILESMTGEARSLAIDFAGLEYVDSAGLGALIRARRVTAVRDGELYILGATEPLLRMLRITGLTALLTVCDEEDLPAL